MGEPVLVGIRCYSRFPLEFRRKPCSRPGGKGGSLIKAHMNDRRIRIERLYARQGEMAFTAIVILEPIERSFPMFFLRARPAVRKPEFRAMIAAIGDEGPIFRVADRARSDAEWSQQRLVTRAFIVEGKALAVMTNQRQAAGHGDHIERLWRMGLDGTIAIGGQQRI